MFIVKKVRGGGKYFFRGIGDEDRVKNFKKGDLGNIWDVNKN